jgi:cyclopropane-fatty-acyl-phospholipid synthase
MFALEHNKSAYWADFGAYGLFVGGMSVALPMLAPRDQWIAMAVLTATGLIAWSLVEYLMHRFILHGLEPFKTWHMKHHTRPTALISSPTLLSASLISVLVFAPAALATTIWMAAALTLGIVAGYLAYALCHHGTHHWRAERPWFKQRKRWHAMHHLGGYGGHGQCFGVTSTVWDRLFRSVPSR